MAGCGKNVDYDHSGDNPSLHEGGCIGHLGEGLHSHLAGLAGMGAAGVVLQVLAVCFACCLARSVQVTFFPLPLKMTFLSFPLSMTFFVVSTFNEIVVAGFNEIFAAAPLCRSCQIAAFQMLIFIRWTTSTWDELQCNVQTQPEKDEKELLYQTMSGLISFNDEEKSIVKHFCTIVIRYVLLLVCTMKYVL